MEEYSGAFTCLFGISVCQLRKNVIRGKNKISFNSRSTLIRPCIDWASLIDQRLDNEYNVIHLSRNIECELQVEWTNLTFWWGGHALNSHTSMNNVFLKSGAVYLTVAASSSCGTMCPVRGGLPTEHDNRREGSSTAPKLETSRSRLSSVVISLLNLPKRQYTPRITYL